MNSIADSTRLLAPTIVGGAGISAINVTDHIGATCTVLISIVTVVSQVWALISQYKKKN